MGNIKNLRAKFNGQKVNAKKRGIEWNLTFKQWCDFWGGDIEKRGRGHDKLQMQRYSDKGGYEIGNIKKGYPYQNSKTAGNVKKNKAAIMNKEEREKQYDCFPVCDEELDDEDIEFMRQKELTKELAMLSFPSESTNQNKHKYVVDKSK